MPKNTGRGSGAGKDPRLMGLAEEHPAVRLYGAVDHRAAAIWWYERAMESAREANSLKDELNHIKKQWWYKLFTGRLL